jgi:hypothetical protein
MAGHGFTFGYMHLLYPPLQSNLHTGTPGPTNVIVCYASLKTRLLAMSECIRRGDVVDLKMFHMLNLLNTSQMGNNDDEISVLES